MKKLLLALLTIAGLSMMPGCRHDCCDTCETYECPEPCCPDRYEAEPHEYYETHYTSEPIVQGACPVKEYYEPSQEKVLTSEPRRVVPTKTTPTPMPRKVMTQPTK